MLYSDERKFVFVAVPKTGTTAIQNRLQEIDPTIVRNHVRNAAGDLVKVATHETAYKLREIMGDQASDVTFIAFLRDPRDVVVSKYYYYRSGRAAREAGLAKRKTGDSVRTDPGTVARVLFAQSMPLGLWARIYPFASSAKFVTGPDGSTVVDCIGTNENLQTDVLRIFGRFGYTDDQLQLGIKNRSDYDRAHARDPKLEAVVAKRLPQDMALYDRVADGGL
ncbi:sulfotransferase family 2 domain-containing protein [Palleronia abyssalis]|uniref:Sulfotransferase family protein n=1 Tax=Palleronia abyssalis TaxID=1501240 RepID=A0A2R8BT02_9RHOB|nr:sulfotransferase family 2 domain-containing protein [Palleronia abyssalis]SPJ23216.1 hypothetical protein PAA8504_01022 [Palleronia abyssalis]